MSKITKEEISSWIRNLIPYLEKPAILAPSGFFDDKEINITPGAIIKYGDALTPNANFLVLEQTENLKVLAELYKNIDS